MTVYISSSYPLPNKVAWVKSIVELQAGDEEALKHAVATIGPVSVAVYTPEDFVYYSHGNNIQNFSCSFYQHDFAVLHGYTCDAL